jgi:hypothetical protein
VHVLSQAALLAQGGVVPPKQPGDIALKAHIATIRFKCFRCFRGVLQVFHIDVAKVDRDVAYVLHMLQWLYTYVASVYSKCFICFLETCCKYFLFWILLSGCCICFAMTFQVFLAMKISFSEGQRISSLNVYTRKSSNVL